MVSYHSFLSFFELRNNFLSEKKYINQFSVQNKEQFSIGNVNLTSTRKYNCDDIIRNYMGIYKVLLLLNERGDPRFYFEIYVPIR